VRVVEVEGNICHWPWNSGVVDVFENQKKIEEEARELQAGAYTRSLQSSTGPS
jgi:hypothetical protein